MSSQTFPPCEMEIYFFYIPILPRAHTLTRTRPTPAQTYTHLSAPHTRTHSHAHVCLRHTFYLCGGSSNFRNLSDCSFCVASCFCCPDTRLSLRFYFSVGSFHSLPTLFPFLLSSLSIASGSTSAFRVGDCPRVSGNSCLCLHADF